MTIPTIKEELFSEFESILKQARSTDQPSQLTESAANLSGDDLLDYFVNLARQVSSRRNGEPQQIFELTKTDRYPAHIAELAESFGMMIVKVEARELLLLKTINDLKQLNETLRAENKERRKAEAETTICLNLFNQIETGICIYRSDADSDSVFYLYRCNPAFEKFDLPGVRCEVNASLVTNLAAFEGLNIEKVCCQVIRTGRPCRLPNTLFTRSNGQNIWLSVAIYRLPDRFLGITFDNITDLTEKKEAEKILNEELELKNRELTSKVLYTASRRERVLATLRDLEQYLQHPPEELRRKVSRSIRYLNEQFNSFSDWDEFESHFLKVHGEFYRNLYQKHPDLSQRERKICAFLKLNMNTKDIANLTNLSVKSIEVYRTRLRKKLQLPKGLNLDTYIAGF